MTTSHPNAPERAEVEETFELLDYESCRTSAVSDNDVKRLRLSVRNAATGTEAQIWLYFEDVPTLYAAKDSVGLRTDGGYWIYRDPADFASTLTQLQRRELVALTCRHSCFPGAQGSSRLVNSADLTGT